MKQYAHTIELERERMIGLRECGFWYQICTTVIRVSSKWIEENRTLRQLFMRCADTTGWHTSRLNDSDGSCSFITSLR